MSESRRSNRSQSSYVSTYDEFRTTSILPPRRYILMTGKPSSEPFGFGSGSPARPHTRIDGFPGPGRYNPHEAYDKTESNRGYGSGFTSIVPRKLAFTRGNKNPAPNAYNPHNIDRKIKPHIGVLTHDKKSSCFPDAKDMRNLPGPGSYNITTKGRLSPSSIFKSKTERNYLPGPPKPPPKFDGRNFVLRIE
ncbi:hypothetical protein M9Y10_013311 [Tritrichomonas musculus]|uniref:Uncharacterized protein n=1 Tax=Tritrichomonas musculus TaxID=1915356 RepID=A0ABR2I724_9EUKA